MNHATTHTCAQVEQAWETNAPENQAASGEGMKTWTPKKRPRHRHRHQHQRWRDNQPPLHQGRAEEQAAPGHTPEATPSSQSARRGAHKNTEIETEIEGLPTGATVQSRQNEGAMKNATGGAMRSAPRSTSKGARRIAAKQRPLPKRGAARAGVRLPHQGRHPREGANSHRLRRPTHPRVPGRPSPGTHRDNPNPAPKKGRNQIRNRGLHLSAAEPTYQALPSDTRPQADQPKEPQRKLRRPPGSARPAAPAERTAPDQTKTSGFY